MRVSPLLVLPLLWSLTLSQHTVPYLSFMGQTLANHSWVDIGQVGTGSDSVQCHTDLNTCCSGAQGVHRGDWYFPNGDRLPFPGGSDIIQSRTAQRVDLRHINNANEPTGIYHCDIETIAGVSGNGMRETVYVGLYTSDGGDITIMGDEVIFDSDQLTLTCISTGGPATTVTWTRDSTTTVTEGTETVLDDPETAQYTHTLTVTTGGEYTCTVKNNKPSSDSATITIGGVSPPTRVSAVQDGPTSIRVTWTPPSPLGDTTGYRISYTGGGGSSGSVDVDGGNTNSHTLVGLTNGETYTISIMSTASLSPGLLPSAPVEAGVIDLSFHREKGEKGEPGSSGAAYVRWGKFTCPDTEGTELLYSGTAAGSHHYEGGGGNYQCLTSEPSNFAFGVQREDAGYIYGAEFETWGNVPPASLPLVNQNVACAVCYVSTRGAVVTIPGTYICPAGWTREYYGYLMSERHKNRRSTFECVDNSPDILPRHEGDEDREGDDEGALFYHVEPRCGSLPCPPYDEQQEITCVVCSR